MNLPEVEHDAVKKPKTGNFWENFKAGKFEFLNVLKLSFEGCLADVKLLYSVDVNAAEDVLHVYLRYEFRVK